MFSNLTGWHAIIILAVVVLLFGAAKLPALARSVGQSMRILRSEVEHPSQQMTTAPAAVAQPTDMASANRLSASSNNGTVNPSPVPLTREAVQA